MKVNSEDLAQKFRVALRAYLCEGGEASLKSAYDLGRYALDAGFGILDITALLHRILAEVIEERHPGEKSAATVRLAQDFFVESLSSFEMTHRGSQEVNLALRRLNEKLNDKLEETAKQIATALHDEAWQLMAVVHIDLYRAAQNVPAATRRRLEKVQRSLKELEQNLRGLSHEIRPKILDDLGVVAALDFLARGISARTGVSITVEGPREQRFSPAIESNLYRIVQEALINSTRHAKATQANVLVRNSGGRLTCSVCDNGVGFKLQEVLAQKGHPGLGLLGIQERVATLGGSLQINSTPGKGTELRVDIPLDKQGPGIRVTNPLA